MKSIILSLFILISMIGYSQTSPGVTAPGTPKTVSELVRNCDSTNLTYKGMRVWRTRSGKYFVVKFSRKTHNPYKYYVKYEPLKP